MLGKNGELDKTLATLGIPLSVFLIAALMLVSERPIFILPGCLLLISCVIWLFIRKREPVENLNHSNRMMLLLSTVFFILLAISILIVGNRPEVYQRPLLYFFLISIMAGTVAAEVMVSNINHKYYILIQVIIVSISLVWSQALLFPTVMGVDTWWHQGNVEMLIASWNIPVWGNYSMLPIFHLCIGSTELITGMSYKYASLWSISIVQILCGIPTIYMFTKHIFNNYRIGLLSSLVLAVGNLWVYQNLAPIPSSFALIFAIIILYLILGLRSNARTSIIGLVLVFSVCLIMTHPITSVCFVILLVAIYFASRIIDSNLREQIRYISLTFVLLFIVIMFSWWVYASSTINDLSELIRWGFSRDNFVNSSSAYLYVTLVPISEELFNSIGTYLFFSLSIIGIFYMISDKSNSLLFVLGFALPIPLVLVFFTQLSSIYIIEDRWWYYAQVLLSIPLGAALYLLSNNKRRRMWKVVLPMLIVVLTFLLTISPTENIDNNALSPNSGIRYSMTVSEMQALVTINGFSDDPLGGDEYYSNTVMKWMGYDAVSVDRGLRDENFSNFTGSLILIRAEVTNGPFKLFQSPYKLDYDPGVVLDGQGFSRIYDSNSIDGYVK